MEISIKDKQTKQTIPVGPALAKAVGSQFGKPDLVSIQSALKEDITRQYGDNFAREIHEQNLKNMRERGISYQKRERVITDEDGNPVLDENGLPKTKQEVVITHIPPIEQWAAAVFAGVTDCWFPECQGFRDELAAREKEAAGDDGTCPSCKRGAIMRQMLPRVKEALLRAGGPVDYIQPQQYNIQYDNEYNQNTRGTGEVSGPERGGKEIAVAKKGMLRRILDRVAKALGYRPEEG